MNHKISSETLQTAINALKNAVKAEKKEVPKGAAVAALKPHIRAARARGLSWAEVREVLAGAGLQVSVPTLISGAGGEKAAKTAPRPTVIKSAKAPATASASSTVPQERLPAGHFAIKKDREL